jgi:hypothetical protein
MILPRESLYGRGMNKPASKLSEMLVIIFEMDGHEGVERYARESGIPLAVCRKIIADYTVSRGLQQLASLR